MPALLRGLDLSVEAGISGPKTWIMFKSTFFCSMNARFAEDDGWSDMPFFVVGPVFCRDTRHCVRMVYENQPFKIS